MPPCRNLPMKSLNHEIRRKTHNLLTGGEGKPFASPQRQAALTKLPQKVLRQKLRKRKTERNAQ